MRTATILVPVLAGLLGGCISCTDLDEKIYSQVVSESYYKTADEVVVALMRPWGHFCGTLPVGQAPWLLQELTADGAAWCQKGVHGYDNGDWIRLHRHEWDAVESQVNQAWYLMYMGIGLANNLLVDFKKVDFEALGVAIPKEQAVAELRVYRAFCYWYLLDLFGTVPIVQTVGVVSPSSQPGTDVFRFIEEELLACIPSLSANKVSTYGRVSKWGACALLARLYLNAEVYTGIPRYTDCVTVCREIERAGYRLDTRWNDPFRVDNDQISGENIWVVVFDQIYAHGFQWYVRWLHYAHQTGWNLKSGPWNGLVTQPDFYNSFRDTDKRKTEGFLIGLQYPRIRKPDGTYLYDESQLPLTGAEEYRGEPLCLVNSIKSMTEGKENSGARSIKYEIAEQSESNQSNDWVLFRYADILYMKAEALMRDNGGVATTEACALINSVVQRAFLPEDFIAYTPETLTLDELLHERGREFAFEGTRRSDLIRFGVFVTTSWWDKKASADPSRNLFPIPRKQLDSNPNLKPNEANRALNSK